MTHHMTFEDAKRVLRNPSMFTQAEVDEAHKLRLDEQREAARPALAPIEIPPDGFPEPDDTGRTGWGIGLALLCAIAGFLMVLAVLLQFAAPFAAELFGWVLNIVEGFWLVALVLAGVL